MRPISWLGRLLCAVNKTAKPGASLLAFAAAVTACASPEGNPLSLHVVGNIAMIRADKTINQCLPSQASLYRSEGVLDLAVASAGYGKYDYYAHIQNLMPSTELASGNSAVHLRMNAGRVSLQSLHAELVTQPAKASLIGGAKTSSKVTTDGTAAGWDVPIQGEIDPGGALYTPLTLLSPQIVAEWATKAKAAAATLKYGGAEHVVVRMRLRGVMGDAQAIESGPIDFPVTICWGCLLYVPTFTAGADPVDPWKVCSKMQVPGDYINPCVVGQDDFVVCSQYCTMCKSREQLGVGKCDTKFCPTLSEEDFPKTTP